MSNRSKQPQRVLAPVKIEEKDGGLSITIPGLDNVTGRATAKGNTTLATTSGITTVGEFRVGVNVFREGA